MYINQWLMLTDDFYSTYHQKKLSVFFTFTLFKRRRFAGPFVRPWLATPITLTWQGQSFACLFLQRVKLHSARSLRHLAQRVPPSVLHQGASFQYPMRWARKRSRIRVHSVIPYPPGIEPGEPGTFRSWIIAHYQNCSLG